MPAPVRPPEGHEHLQPALSRTSSCPLPCVEDGISSGISRLGGPDEAGDESCGAPRGLSQRISCLYEVEDAWEREIVFIAPAEEVLGEVAEEGPRPPANVEGSHVDAGGQRLEELG